MQDKSNDLFSPLLEVIRNLDPTEIPEVRKKDLTVLIDFIQKKVSLKEKVNLNFICTHNSRRSHLSQAWAQAISTYFDIPGVHCYSGGTEATALFPMAVRTLEEAGFQICRISETLNPVYSLKFAPNEPPVIGFSKAFDHPFNPERNYAAIMTCSQADAECPFIPGAEKRIPLPFDDPKAFDNTPEQADKYKERSMQIATELYHVFSKIQLQ